MQKIEVVRSLAVEIHDVRCASCAKEWAAARAAATAVTARRCPLGPHEATLLNGAGVAFDQVSKLDT
jgi:hypothetical protein